MFCRLRFVVGGVVAVQNSELFLHGKVGREYFWCCAEVHFCTLSGHFPYASVLDRAGITGLTCPTIRALAL